MTKRTIPKTIYIVFDNTYLPLQYQNEFIPQLPQTQKPTAKATPSSSLSAWRNIKAKEKIMDPFEIAVTQYFSKKSAYKSTDRNSDLDLSKAYCLT